MVHDKTQQSTEKSQVNLLIHSCQHCLHHHDRFAFRSVPNIGQVVNTLTPFVNEEGRGLRIGGLDRNVSESFTNNRKSSYLDPTREKPSLIGLIPQELVKIRVTEFFERLNVYELISIQIAGK